MKPASRSLAFVALVILATPSTPARGDVARLLDVRKIWSEAPHNAFTDLVRFKDVFYLAFREGSTHTVPPAGQHGGNLITLQRRHAAGAAPNKTKSDNESELRLRK